MKSGASADGALSEALAQIFASASSVEWISTLERERVPCSPVQQVSDLYDDPQMKRNGLSVDYDSPDLGPITLRGAPAIFLENSGVSEKAARAWGSIRKRCWARSVTQARKSQYYEAVRRSGEEYGRTKIAENKKALVTGGGVGIGESIALAFAREGADVAIASRNTANLERVAAKIREMGRQCLPITVDIADEDQVIAMVKRPSPSSGG